MKYFLIEQSCNWADEFDMNGFWLGESEDEEELIKSILKDFLEEHGDFPVETYFGTNEAMEFENENDYLATLSIREITKNEFNVINNVLGGSYGQVF